MARSPGLGQSLSLSAHPRLQRADGSMKAAPCSALLSPAYLDLFPSFGSSKRKEKKGRSTEQVLEPNRTEPNRMEPKERWCWKRRVSRSNSNWAKEWKAARCRAIVRPASSTLEPVWNRTGVPIPLDGSGRWRRATGFSRFVPGVGRSLSSLSLCPPPLT